MYKQRKKIFYIVGSGTISHISKLFPYFVPISRINCITFLKPAPSTIEKGRQSFTTHCEQAIKQRSLSALFNIFKAILEFRVA